MWLNFILPNLIIAISLTLITIKLPPNYRLTKDVGPEKYDIQIQPYLLQQDGSKQFSFDGTVNITLRASRDQLKKIILHKKEIIIQNMTLYDKYQFVIQNFKRRDMFYYEELDQLVLKLRGHLLLHGQYFLYIKYSGKIHNHSHGLFRFSYDKGESWQVLTLLQPLGARLVLPCFDEPEFKASYSLRVTRPINYKSYFNTQLIKTTKKGKYLEIDCFASTPLMSSYLLAIMITNFVGYGENVIKMITPIEKVQETYFAFKVSENVLNFLDIYFQRSYQKLGNPVMQITFTNKYKYLAMENWGLIVFRDLVLLQIPDNSNAMSNQQKCISTIIHELIHMWFGNSVTLKWWSYFWLNEAFARYYEFVVGDILYTDFKFEQQFVVNKLHLVFDIDAKSNSEPMSSKEDLINTPNEIRCKVNRISYEKGAAILRMFSNAMGRNNFNAAMRVYLKENHLKNTVPEDLFRHLRKYWPTEQKVNLKQFFQDWTEQPGYPVLTITTNNRGEFLLKQKRYFLKDQILTEPFLTYTIPITFTSDIENDFENLTPKFYFNKTLSQITFGHIEDQKWLILNLQQANYYRVFYSPILLEKLRQAFLVKNFSGIHVLNRASMIDDLFSFAYNDLMDFKTVFQYLEYMTTELEYLPWQTALKGFNIMIHKRLNPLQRKKFSQYLFKILDFVYRNLKHQSSYEKPLDIYKRNEIIKFLCKYQHRDCNTQVHIIFHDHLSRNTKPQLDFRETLYCASSRNDASNQIYDILMKWFVNSSWPQEKEMLLRAMSCNRYNVDNHFNFILSENVTLNMKFMGLTNLFSQTFENLLPVFQLIRENINRLSKSLQSWKTLVSLICDISNYFTSENQLSMLRRFVSERGYKFGKYLADVQNCIKNVESNLKWTHKNLGDLFN